MSRVDRPGPPQGGGHVTAVHHQLAQQDAQGEIGPHPSVR